MRSDSPTIQALILTKDEEPNIGRVLGHLDWLESVVVLDSFSTDATEEIVRSFPNTSFHQREFDTHANQWNQGLSLLNSEWVLSLDADYVLTPDFVQEIIDKISVGDRSAYLASFKFLVFGEPLLRDNTTPRPVLFKRASCQYFDDGHTQRLAIDGPTAHLSAKIMHDDRKSLSRWIDNQSKYSIRECEKLTISTDERPSITSRLRKTKVLAPLFVFFYCLVIQGGIFGGWRGWHYTLQRTIVEMLLALRLIEKTEFDNK